MTDEKPIAIAMTVGTLALFANGAAAVVALSATAQPAALGFGIAGIGAAFIGLVVTILWARAGRAERNGPFVVVELPAFDDEPAQDAAAASPAEAAPAAAALAAGADRSAPSNENVVVYLRDWVDARAVKPRP